MSVASVRSADNSQVLTSQMKKESEVPSRGRYSNLRRLQAVYQSSHVPDGVEAAPGAVAKGLVGVALKSGDVIGTHRTIETDLLIATHRLDHIGLSIVVKGLDEARGGPPNIAEVDKVDLATPAKVANGIGDVGPHRGKVPLTQRNTVVVARSHLYSPLEGIDIREDARNASDRGERGVIGM